MNLPHSFPLYFFLVVLIAGLAVRSDAMVYKEQLNVQELKLLFGEDGCIEGTLSVSEMGSPVFQSVTFTEPVIKLDESNTSENFENKSPMSMVNELAFFNNILYQYILTAEEGPAHQKLFVVSLHLGEEEYSAEGSSIKKAQHSAAQLALNSTLYEHPPKKPHNDQLHKSNNRPTPVEKLEEWVGKRWDALVMYSFQEHSIVGFSNDHKNYFHENMYSKPASIHKVTVKIGQREFTGEGSTSDSAKQKAANDALQVLQNVDGFCLFEDKLGNLLSRFFYSDGENDSPISLVHAFASKSKQEVSFNVFSEEGPAHMKMYTFKCSIGDKFESFGKGSSKKAAKKEAALNMIGKLKSHADNNSINCGGIIRKNKKTKNHNARKIVKSVVNMHSKHATESKYSFPDDINPISKLIQIQQLNYDNQPVFTFLEEEGEITKQFFIEVKVGNSVFVGSGPNKKIAKRRAAEGMLKILGYFRSSEGIRVSSSGQKKKEFANEHITSKKKPIASGLHLNSETFARVDHNKEPSYLKSNPSVEFDDSRTIKSKDVVKDNLAKSKNKITSDFKEPRTQLDQISQKLGLRFQFSDFPKNNNSGFVSLLSLTTDPPKVCYGTGTTTEMSQDNAARTALKDLYKIQLATISDILREPALDTISEDGYQINDKIVQEETITEL